MHSLKPTPSRPQIPPTHDSRNPDLAYPVLTTAISHPTGEYRETTETGIVSGTDLVRQITGAAAPSLHRAPTRQRQQAETTAAVAARVPSASGLSDSDIERLEKFQFVTFKTEDREDPRQWSNAFKWYVTAVVAIAVVQVAFASAVVTGDFEDVQSEFGVSRTVVALTVSLMVVGFG